MEYFMQPRFHLVYNQTSYCPFLYILDIFFNRTNSLIVKFKLFINSELGQRRAYVLCLYSVRYQCSMERQCKKKIPRQLFLLC